MRKGLIWFIILITGLSLIPCEGTKQENSSKTIYRLNINRNGVKRVALVIGNNNYEKGKLSNSVDDARGIKNFLESRNFKVIYGEDTNEETMRKKISIFLNNLDSQSVGFIYFSGHGIQEYSKIEKRTVNYLIPIDNTKINTLTDLDYHSISLNYILDSLSEKQNRLNIVLLDSCRTPFKSFTKSMQVGLAPSNANGVFIAYATASGEKAPDNGLFRKTFIKYAQKPLKLIDIFEKVKEDIFSKTRQTIFTSNGKRGAFYFSTSMPTQIPNIVQDREEICNTIIECNMLGKKYKNSGSYKKAKKFYQKACDKDSPIGCNELGWIYKKIDEEYKKASELYKKACDLEYGLACANIGWMYEEGKFLEKNYKKAIYLYEKGCNLNNGYSCGNLAGMYFDGNGIEVDIDKAKELYMKGCFLGHKKSCKRMDELSNQEDIQKHGIDLTLKKNQKCSSSSDCMKLAKKYRENKEFNKAKEFYLKACNLDSGVACNDLGWIYKKLDKDFNNAKKFYEKSCNLNYGLGCANAGWLYEEGNGIRQNYKKALKLYKKGCNLDNGHSCSSLGGMYIDGKGISKDIYRAIRLYKKSCKLGNQYGCENLNKLLRN